MKKLRKNSLWNLVAKDPQYLSHNDLTLVNYFKWLKNLALSMFKWEGLPETIDVRYLEETLFTKGKLLFFKDEIHGFLSLSCLPASDVNVYGRPIHYHVHSYGYDKNVKASESVLIINNDLEEPSMFTVGAFASRLSEIERTTDININAQKTPILILTDDKQLLTLKNLYAQYQGNAPVIFANKNMLNPESVKVLKTDAPYIVDKLDQHKMNLWNEVLTFLGIQNVNTEKKERLLVDEVNANNQHVNLNADILLKNREEACEKINTMFGLKTSVKLRYKEEEIENVEKGFFPYHSSRKDGEENE